MELRIISFTYRPGTPCCEAMDCLTMRHTLLWRHLSKQMTGPKQLQLARRLHGFARRDH